MPNNIQETISIKHEMEPDAFQLFGGTEAAESEYINTNEMGDLVQNLGHREALFAYNDRIVA